MQGGDKNRVVFVKTDMNKISDSQSSDHHHTTCGLGLLGHWAMQIFSTELL